MIGVRKAPARPQAPAIPTCRKEPESKPLMAFLYFTLACGFGVIGYGIYVIVELLSR